MADKSHIYWITVIKTFDYSVWFWIVCPFCVLLVPDLVEFFFLYVTILYLECIYTTSTLVSFSICLGLRCALYLAIILFFYCSIDFFKSPSNIPSLMASLSTSIYACKYYSWINASSFILFISCKLLNFSSTSFILCKLGTITLGIIVPVIMIRFLQFYSLSCFFYV